MSTQADWQLYATHSACSDPGAWGAQLDAVPGDLRSIKDAAHQLVFHYRADGDWTENGIAPERIAEIDTRFADRMLQRIFALSGAPLGAPRPPNQRLVGCCRDFTLFFVALARQKGIPARSRVGFATYFMAGWNLDHIVAEVWDAVQHRWRLVDAELRDGHVDAAGRVIDPLDVPRDRFIVGPQAWLACRAGEADPERFVVAPDLEIPETRGWPYLMHNLIHDLAALNAREMLLWEDWGMTMRQFPLPEDQLALLDRAAGTMTSPDSTLEDLRHLYERDEFRVPEMVTSFSPALTDVPAQVRIAREPARST
jgi:hypothetical protein